MRMTKTLTGRIARLALALLLAVPALRAQETPPPAGPEPAPGEARCGWCQTTGRTPFDAAGEFQLELETGPTWKVTHCSEALTSDNMGLPWAPCARCKTPSLQAKAQAEWDGRRKAGDAWLKDRRRADVLAGVDDPLVHVQTTHFLVVWNIPRITTAAKKSYDEHEAAHLYARRLEELYARYQKMFGITDRNNMKNLHTVMVFEKPEQQAGVAPAYTGLEGLPTVQRAGGANHDSVTVTWWDKGFAPKEIDMWRHQIHEAIHQFTAVYYDIMWFKPGEIGLSPPWLNDKYGWMIEGLAHWFEIDLDRRSETYCMREQNVDSRWGGTDWRKNIYKAVSGGDIPVFSEVINKPNSSLTAKENQFAWSWVDFLLSRDAAAMGKAMKLAKQKMATRDILKEAWGLSMLDFEAQWKAWVLETYAPTKKA
jgi:hypothetical protein